MMCFPLLKENLSTYVNSVSSGFNCSLIKEGLCDRGSAPSISAISRLLRGHDGEDSSQDKKLSDGKSKENNILLSFLS